MKIRRIYIASLALCITTTSVKAADWVNNWLDNATRTGSSSFKSQKRGYYSLGGFSGRLNSSTDYPVSIALPKMKIGCGGIDAFYGGVSFLDEDFIVQKLEGMMQAAPYVAFDIALKALTKEFSETLNKAESIATALNGIQLNECAMAKSAVTTVVSGDWQDVGQNLWTTMSQETELNAGTSRNAQEAAQNIRDNDNTPTVDLGSRLNGCSADFKSYFGEAGSLISKTTVNYGMSDYANIVRGYIGDVTINISNAGKIPIPEEILPCENNADGSIEDFIYGYAEERNEAGVCSQHTVTGLDVTIRKNMDDLANTIIARGNIEANQTLVNFIQNSPLPVYRVVLRALIDGTYEQTAQELTDILSYAYADRIFDDMFRNTRNIMHRITKEYTDGGQYATNSNTCDKDLIKGIQPKLASLEKRLFDTRNQMREGYEKKLLEHKAMSDFVIRQEQLDKRIKKSTKAVMGVQDGE